jgi:sensor histidine kinase YesM
MRIQRKTIIYWVLQFLFWDTLSGVMALGYLVTNNQLNLKTWQIVLDFLMVVILSIFFTHQFRRVLKKTIAFDNIKVLDVFKIFGLLLLTTVLFYLSFTLYIRFTYTFIYERIDVFDHPSQSLKNNIVFLLNYGIYFFIWAVFYVAIKSLMELNKSREERLELESSLKESQLNTLKGQINPHFMFNSLNNIRGLMLEDVNKARNMLTSLSETLRYSLTKSGVDAIALEDELEMVDNYIELSKIQFEDRLEYKTAIDDDALHVKIPPMLIQMLVENAIKHGISKLKQGGTVEVRTQLHEGWLEIQVANSGTLASTENTTQVGLENIKRRIALLYGEKGKFALREINDQVVATIKIPLA